MPYICECQSCGNEMTFEFEDEADDAICEACFSSDVLLISNDGGSDNAE